MKVSLVATFLPPPHLARAGAEPQRMTKEISSVVAHIEISAVIQAAIDTGVFDAGGCVNVVIQRAAVRTPDTRPT